MNEYERVIMQKAQDVITDSNLLSLAAAVMFGNIFLVAELWTFGILFQSF